MAQREYKRRIITVVSFKGGVGKTTTAMHLATYLAKRNFATVLFDADRNKSASDWANAYKGEGRGLLYPVYSLKDINKIPGGKWDYGVIDAEARPDPKKMSELAKYNFMVVPMIPDEINMWATMRMLKEIQNYSFWKIQHKILLTAVPPKPSRDGEDVREALEKSNIPIFQTDIPRLSIFKRAGGLGVTTDRLKGNYAKKAWNAYSEAFQELDLKYQ